MAVEESGVCADDQWHSGAMRVGILGSLQVVTDDGEIVQIGGARLRTLLIRLALSAGRTVTVESLSSALWPDDGPTDRANALQSLMTRLRRALPGEPAVRSLPAGYRLDLPPEAVDALRFEQLAREGRRALRDGQAQTAARHLREALGLWRGQALADVADTPFAAAAAVRLEELRLTAIEDCVKAELETASDHSHLVAELEELTAAYPLRERLRALLVKALHADGRQAEALAAYERYRRLLADELGADPGRELQDAHLAVLRGERVAERPSGTSSRGNLRAALSSFVGRSEERNLISRQLKEGRLVTLVGPGGAGKTRLATEFAAAIADEVPGGVWLVELAAVTDPGDVPQAVIGTLGLREVSMIERAAAPHEPMSRLVEALSATRTLIVLDGCEHLIDAAARLVDELLGRCPRLRLLATSREPLGVPGETLCPVGPLGLPEPGTSASEAMTYPVVRLFADRVAAVRPGFTVTDDNIGAVVEICRRLDGLPLAIELAAARLRALPLQELATRLDDRFRLLTGGSRTALPRHRTLRAVVAWSWDLLSEDERRLAERLAVFPATITAEAAGQVCACGAAVLDTLSALVDKSLLQVVEADEPRYRMLETIREYGLERLAEAGEIGRVRAAHATWFLRLAEAAEPQLRGPGQVPWIVRLAAERGNLLVALHFARDTGDAETAVRLGAALGLFWTMQGNHAEAAGLLRLVLDVPGEAPKEARAIATTFYLLNGVLAGDRVHADVVVEELRARVHTPEALLVAHPAAVLVEPALALSIDDAAQGLAAIDRWLSHPDPWTRGMLWLMQSFLHGNDGDMDSMRGSLAAAVEAFRQAGERWGLATAQTYLAYTQIMIGDFDGAIVALQESIRLLRDLDAADETVLQRVWLAQARAYSGEVEGARAELLKMVAPTSERSPVRYLVLARIALGDLARHGGDLEEAARQYDAASKELDRLPVHASVFGAMLLCSRGHLAVATGALAVARGHLEQALALAMETPDMPLVAVIGVGVARLRLGYGDAAGAAQVLGAAHVLRGTADQFNPDVAGLAQQLRVELGEPSYKAAYIRGGGLDRAGALAQLEAQLRRR